MQIAQLTCQFWCIWSRTFNFLIKNSQFFSVQKTFKCARCTRWKWAKRNGPEKNNKKCQNELSECKRTCYLFSQRTRWATGENSNDKVCTRYMIWGGCDNLNYRFSTVFDWNIHGGRSVCNAHCAIVHGRKKRCLGTSNDKFSIRKLQ